MGSPARPVDSAISEAVLPVGRPPLEVVPPAARRPAPPLQKAARRGGAAIGSAQVKVRALLSRVTETGDRLHKFRSRVREDATAAATGWGRTGEQKLVEARRGAWQMVENNALYVIAGVGLAAFTLGFAMRIRRSRNAHR